VSQLVAFACLIVQLGTCKQLIAQQDFFLLNLPCSLTTKVKQESQYYTSKQIPVQNAGIEIKIMLFAVIVFYSTTLMLLEFLILPVNNSN